MALPSSGQISLGDVNVELGLNRTTQISLGGSSTRGLYALVSGAIRLAADGYNKANAFIASIATNQQELNLRTWALANGWDGTTKAIITINSGVYIWSDNVATPALTINGSWPGGIELINNGFIMGKGGKGAPQNSETATGSYTGENGGPAISLGINVTINSSNGYIGGGGGGGNGLILTIGSRFGATGGGGAGGGRSGNGNFQTFVAGAPGGAPGNSGSNGTVTVGGGGGRILPGSRTNGGSYTSNNSTRFTISGVGGTAGGSAGLTNQKLNAGDTVTSGYGGGPNEAGGIIQLSGNGTSAPRGGGGGGGWGAAGGQQSDPTNYPAALSSGGKAVTLNGFTVTWVGGFPSSRVFGAVS